MTKWRHPVRVWTGRSTLKSKESNNSERGRESTTGLRGSLDRKKTRAGDPQVYFGK